MMCSVAIARDGPRVGAVVYRSVVDVRQHRRRMLDEVILSILGGPHLR